MLRARTGRRGDEVALGGKIQIETTKVTLKKTRSLNEKIKVAWAMKCMLSEPWKRTKGRITGVDLPRGRARRAWSDSPVLTFDCRQRRNQEDAMVKRKEGLVVAGGGESAPFPCDKRKRRAGERRSNARSLPRTGKRRRDSKWGMSHW